MASSKYTHEGNKTSPTIPDSILADDSKKWKEKVPVGIRFRPTDQVLAGYYLAGKVSGHTDGPIFQLIKDVDFCQCEPSKLSRLTYDFGDGKMYFFTRFFPGKTNVYRYVTGGGFWKANAKETSSVTGKDKKPLAAKTTLVYYHKNEESTQTKKTQWRMKEYMLLDNQMSEQTNEHNKMLVVWTLCVATQVQRETKLVQSKEAVKIPQFCKMATSSASDNELNKDHLVKTSCESVDDKCRRLKRKFLKAC